MSHVGCVDCLRAHFAFCKVTVYPSDPTRGDVGEKRSDLIGAPLNRRRHQADGAFLAIQGRRAGISGAASASADHRSARAFCRARRLMTRLTSGRCHAASNSCCSPLQCGDRRGHAWVRASHPRQDVSGAHTCEIRRLRRHPLEKLGRSRVNRTVQRSGAIAPLGGTFDRVSPADRRVHQDTWDTAHSQWVARRAVPRFPASAR